MINVTWTPPVAPNGIIYQYIVQRVNSSGKFHHHVPANQHTISLLYFNNTLVFVAAVNLYGQSNFKHAVPKGMQYIILLALQILGSTLCINFIEYLPNG